MAQLDKRISPPVPNVHLTPFPSTPPPICPTPKATEQGKRKQSIATSPMATSSLLTTTTATPSSSSSSSKPSLSLSLSPATPPPPTTRRRLLSASVGGIALSSATSLLSLLPVPSARAEESEEYVRDTTAVIAKLRSTINMPKSDPNLEYAVSDLRESSNAWVAKFRKERALLGRSSYRDVYSALNAVSGHYISFGPTAPIPAKRKARILEEVDSAEKALLRGR